MSYGFYDPENTNRKPVLEVNVYNQRSRCSYSWHKWSSCSIEVAMSYSEFGHVARVRLSDNTPAHKTMLRQVELSVGRPQNPSWKRPPGRPRTKWTDQLRRDNNNVPIATLLRQAIGRGLSRSTLRSEPTTR